VRSRGWLPSGSAASRSPCTERGLDLPDRLALFVQVLRTLQYATTLPPNPINVARCAAP
jgi:hypothetical protein